MIVGRGRRRGRFYVSYRATGASIVTSSSSSTAEQIERLQTMVVAALAIADELHLHDVAIRLEQARLTLAEIGGRN